jgi:hypothetical protein
VHFGLWPIPDRGVGLRDRVEQDRLLLHLRLDRASVKGDQRVGVDHGDRLTEAQQDRFDHEAIAGVVGDLTLNATPPVDIALFGPGAPVSRASSDCSTSESASRTSP